MITDKMKRKIALFLKDQVTKANMGTGGNASFPTTEQLDAYETAAADEEYNNAQIAKRVAEYGSAAEQLEIIVEQGADALASRNNAIKAKYPKK